MCNSRLQFVFDSLYFVSVGSDSEREDEAGGAADGEENESLADDAMEQPAEDPSTVVAFHLFGGKLSHLVMDGYDFLAVLSDNNKYFKLRQSILANYVKNVIHCA